MENLLPNLVDLFLLILLQAVLGFDNLLYISLESKRAPVEKQKFVRQLGIGIAIFLRIGLLFVLVNLLDTFTKELFSVHTNWIHGSFNGRSLITLLGGIFILWTAVKEIMHMMSLEDINVDEKTGGSAAKVIALIVMMNLIFSVDSILSAIAISDNIYVMATAIVISGILMIWLAEKVTEFLKKNRLYEVLGLFVLFVVGIMLITEGAHLAHLKLFNNEINAMSKTTFYFVIVILFFIDIVQGRYTKRLLLEKKKKEELLAKK